MSGADPIHEGNWEIVVGLEVHAELRTETKLFCACRNAFGDEPNTNICPVCLGLPGSLPVLNRQAVAYAMAIGEALNCRVVPSLFHRKNYFYPDMPKDYQISQYDEPINVDGWLELPTGKRIGIVRAHMEEDTGKSTHVGGSGRIGDSQYSLVDYNRAGVPLVEIVSAPDLSSPEEARAYVTELRAVLVAIGASDGKMEEGSLRVDANVSVRAAHSAKFGTRCEVKNLNSLRSLGRAISYEARRQIEELSEGRAIVQETRHWNEDDGRTIAGRTKEEAEDYRYFPEPDLVPVVPDEQWLGEVRAGLPPLPAARREALAAAAGVAPADVGVVVELDLDGLVLGAIERGATPATALNRAKNEVAADIDAARRLDVGAFAALVTMEDTGKLTATQAKQVLAELLAGATDPEAVAREKGFEAMAEDALGGVVDEVIAAHPDEWQRFREGDQKLTGFFVGQVMKRTQGQADGKAVTALLRTRT